MKLSKKSFLFFILIIGMIFSGCEKKKTEEIKPVPVVKSASQKYQEKMNEVKQLRQKLVTKKELTAEKEKFFQGKVQEIKQEILAYSGPQFETYAVAVANQQVKNRLMNIQKYDAYIKKVSELDAQITIGIDDLLTVERQFEADYQMLSLTEEIKIDDLIKQVDAVIKKHLPYANDLVLDIKPDEDLETIWNQIKAEKEEKEKAEKKEKLRLELEEKARIKKEKLEKLRLEREEKARIKKEQLEKIRLEEEEKARIKKEQLEKLRLEREEKARIEKEQLEKLRLEREEKARIEKEQLEKLRAEQEEEQTRIQAENRMNQQIEEEIQSGFYQRINELTEIRPEILQKVWEKDNESVSLNSLKTLTPEVIRILSNFTNKVSLDGLKSLDLETAQALINFKAKNISLYGLSTISREALKVLSNWNGDKLYLEGIEELPVEVAVFMAKEGRKYENLGISWELQKQLKSYDIEY